jgi:hypothetical protein
MNRRWLFVLFFLVASISATSVLNARGSTINLCANKKSGALRYLKNRDCNRSENKIKLDQNGEVGQTGPQGPQGPQGPAGSDGSGGQTGPQGPAGSNLKWIDAAGNQLGDFVEYSNPRFLYNGIVFNFSPLISNGYSGNYGNFFYTDALCTNPMGAWNALSTQVAFYSTSANLPDATPRVWWRSTGVTRTIRAGESLYRFNDFPGGACVLHTVQDAPTSDIFRGLTITEVAFYSGNPPSYISPVSLVYGS